MISSLSELDERVANQANPVGIAVVNAADEAALSSLAPLTRAGVVRPLLIDSNPELALMASHHLVAGSYEIHLVSDDAAAAAQGVALVRQGVAGALMKGHISSGVFLKAVVDKQTGIRSSAVLSHVALVEIPRLGRVVAMTDGGMVAVPGEEQLEAIIDHAVEVVSALGCARPRVALLSAAETVIPKLSSAQIQQRIAQRNIRENVVIEGPLSLDIALVPGIGDEKGYPGKVSGNADILVAPDIVAGNSVSKSIIYFGGGAMAGVVLGAQCPIILVSRSADADEKRYSIELAISMGDKS